MTFLLLLALLQSQQWWILERSTDSRDNAPRAIGPYPTAELCRLAGFHRYPGDRRFYTKKDIEEAEKLAAAQSAERKAVMAKEVEALLRKSPKGGTLHIENHRLGWDCGTSTFEVKPDGTYSIQGGTGCVSGFYFGGTPTALTGCIAQPKDTP